MVAMQKLAQRLDRVDTRRDRAAIARDIDDDTGTPASQNRKGRLSQGLQNGFEKSQTT